MDYTIIIVVALIVFGYFYLYIGGRHYLREYFTGNGQPIMRNNVPPQPNAF